MRSADVDWSRRTLNVLFLSVDYDSINRLRIDIITPLFSSCLSWASPGPIASSDCNAIVFSRWVNDWHALACTERNRASLPGSSEWSFVHEKSLYRFSQENQISADNLNTKFEISFVSFSRSIWKWSIAPGEMCIVHASWHGIDGGTLPANCENT